MQLGSLAPKLQRRSTTKESPSLPSLKQDAVTETKETVNLDSGNAEAVSIDSLTVQIHPLAFQSIPYEI